MNDLPSADDDGVPLVVRAVSAPSPRWVVYLYGTQSALAVVSAVLRPSPSRWVVVAFWAVAAGFFLALRRAQLRRPAELVLGSEGLVSRPALGKERRHVWDDVERLDVDPSGGARTVNLTLRGGGFRRLLAIADDDVPAVRSRWQQVAARRPATPRR